MKSSQEGRDYMSFSFVSGPVPGVSGPETRGRGGARRGLLALAVAGVIAVAACTTPNPPASTPLPTPAVRPQPTPSPSPAASPAAAPSPAAGAAASPAASP